VSRGSVLLRKLRYADVRVKASEEGAVARGHFFFVAMISSPDRCGNGSASSTVTSGATAEGHEHTDGAMTTAVTGAACGERLPQ